MFNKPNPDNSLDTLEKQVLAFWKDRNILDKSIAQRPADHSKTFYDGPITANGEPHTGHMLTFAMKDIIPRYWTMKGFRVDRSLGWDTQGIPVEYEVEKELGFKQKSDIEKFGIAKFNDLCRASVEKYKHSLIQLEERIGRLSNDAEEYATMDPDYIESVWWSLKEIYEKGLLYEGFKAVPYSTRAGTTLSNAEVALGGYRPFKDPAVTIKFELVDDPGTFVLAWTTTPWTLPTNFGLAVGKDTKYAKFRFGDEFYILAKELGEKVLGAGELVAEISGDELAGRAYRPLFDFFPDKENAYRIFFGSHVTNDSGTGIVHLAPYGAEDLEIFAEKNIEVVDVLDDDGNFTEAVPAYSGKFYRDANPLISDELRQKGLLFKEEEYEHEMPFCWRTNTPLIYKPITSWYIAMSRLRDQLTANNLTVNWVPDHIREGRFGNWLTEIKDWAVSRSRYWGTPLPIWKSPSGKVKVFGSFAELESLTGKTITDPHRPFVDEFEFELDGELYRRIPDVLDVWYDSGAMPFARFHYPFENTDLFERKFPAQYIAEGVDQTRGWFYSLLAIATAVFDKSPYENVVVNGFILDDKGFKLSKSKKNYDPPHTLIAKNGADAVRMSFFSSPLVSGEDATVSDRTAKTQLQELILPLLNSVSFLVTYANIHDWTPTPQLAYNDRSVWDDKHPWDHIPFGDIENELDAWALVRLQNTIGEVTRYLDEFDIPRASRALKDYITDLSKWYIRRSRDRFNSGELRSLETLYYVLVEFCKLAAPFIPFVTEHIYQLLVKEVTTEDEGKESIHLTDYPVVDVNFLQQYAQTLPDMELVRRIAEMGQTLRAGASLKVRQPLAELQVEFTQAGDEAGLSLTPWMSSLLADELNILIVREVPSLTQEAEFITAEDPAARAKVALNTQLTPELTEAGLVRELVRAFQALRKQSGLQIGEQVRISFSTDADELKAVLQKRSSDIAAAVSATELIEGEGEHLHDINGMELRVSLEKA